MTPVACSRRPPRATRRPRQSSARDDAALKLCTGLANTRGELVTTSYTVDVATVRADVAGAKTALGVAPEGPARGRLLPRPEGEITRETARSRWST